MPTTAQPKIAKDTEGFIIYAPSGSDYHSTLCQVRVKMVRSSGSVVTTMGTRAIGDFYLDADDAAAALERVLRNERDEARERDAEITETLAKLDGGSIPYKDMRRFGA